MTDVACRCVDRPPGSGCIWPKCLKQPQPSNPVEDLAEVRRKMSALIAFAQRVARVDDDDDDAFSSSEDAARTLWALVREARQLMGTGKPCATSSR